MIIQDLENEILSIFDFDIPFFYRYVDDIIMAISASKTDIVYKKFNFIYCRLQFTLINGYRKINFLDTTIIIENNKIKFDLYHKPTFSGRYLNFWSQHPLTHKKGLIFSLLDRVLLISHPDYHAKNLESVVRILLEIAIIFYNSFFRQ